MKSGQKNTYTPDAMMIRQGVPKVSAIELTFTGNIAYLHFGMILNVVLIIVLLLSSKSLGG